MPSRQPRDGVGGVQLAAQGQGWGQSPALHWPALSGRLVILLLSYYAQQQVPVCHTMLATQPGWGVALTIPDSQRGKLPYHTVQGKGRDPVTVPSFLQPLGGPGDPTGRLQLPPGVWRGQPTCSSSRSCLVISETTGPRTDRVVTKAETGEGQSGPPSSD